MKNLLGITRSGAAMASALALTLSPALLSPAYAQNADGAAQAEAPAATLSIEQRTALRCAAAFAIIAKGQEAGNAAALKYPAMNERGREYFVRAAAQIMDDTKMNREQVAEVIAREAQDMANKGTVEDIMPACVLLLDQSGL